MGYRNILLSHYFYNPRCKALRSIISKLNFPREMSSIITSQSRLKLACILHLAVSQQGDVTLIENVPLPWHGGGGERMRASRRRIKERQDTFNKGSLRLRYGLMHTRCGICGAGWKQWRYLRVLAVANNISETQIQCIFDKYDTIRQ